MNIHPLRLSAPRNINVHATMGTTKALIVTEANDFVLYTHDRDAEGYREHLRRPLALCSFKQQERNPRVLKMTCATEKSVKLQCESAAACQECLAALSQQLGKALAQTEEQNTAFRCPAGCERCADCGDPGIYFPALIYSDIHLIFH